MNLKDSPLGLVPLGKRRGKSLLDQQSTDDKVVPESIKDGDQQLMTPQMKAL